MIENVTTLLTVVGALAFAVSVITEVCKNTSGLKSIPTDILVLVTSIALAVIVSEYYMCEQNIYPAVVYRVGAIIGGFIVAFVAMFGWEKLTDLWVRLKK